MLWQDAAMKFGLAFANTARFISGEGAARMGRAAEAAGFESVWTVEHIVYPEGYESSYPYSRDGKMPGGGDAPIPDPLVWLAFVAANTTELKLATGISLLPEHHPVTYAKEVATLDSMSNGRVILGIGIGWLREEFAALGIPWQGRARRTEEYAEVMRALWASDDVSFDGEFVSFANLSSNPKPAAGPVPIHIGGHSRASAERAGRMGDGFFPAGGDLAELFDIARQSAADAGRDPEAIEMTGSHPGVLGKDPGAAVEQAVSWGMHRMLVPAYRHMRDTEESMAAFGEQVIVSFG